MDMDSTGIYVGVDVSSSTLAVGILPSGEVWENDAEGVAALRDRLSEMEPTLIVMEATGGIEGWSSVSCMRRDCA